MFGSHNRFSVHDCYSRWRVGTAASAPDCPQARLWHSASPRFAPDFAGSHALLPARMWCVVYDDVDREFLRRIARSRRHTHDAGCVAASQMSESNMTIAISSSVRPGASAGERGALRVIAVFEATKGVAALASTIGLLALLHHDLHHLALELVGHFGLNPSEHFPALLLACVDQVNGTPLRSVVLLGSAYVMIRAVEAYGLWFDRSWGEWVAALSGALYVPFEIQHLLHHTTVISALVLLFNLGVVGFMLRRLYERR